MTEHPGLVELATHLGELLAGTHTWHTFSMKIRRTEDGHVLVDGLRLAEDPPRYI